MRAVLVVAVLLSLTPVVALPSTPTTPPSVKIDHDTVQRMVDAAAKLADGHHTFDVVGFVHAVEVDGCVAVDALPPEPYIPYDYSCADPLEFIVPNPCNPQGDPTQYVDCMGQKFCIDFEYTGVGPLGPPAVPSTYEIEFDAYGLLKTPAMLVPIMGPGHYTVLTDTRGGLDCTVVDEE
jgi:hypothetical protein